MSVIDRPGNHNGWVDSAADAVGGSGADEAPERQVFTSRLKGRPLLDSSGLVIGRVSDTVLLSAVGSEAPRALGLVVALRRRSIFVGFGRIAELAVDGAHLLGGTVDLEPFTKRTGEIMASDLYGRHTADGTVADVAIACRDGRRDSYVVKSIAIKHGRGRRGRGPEIVPWQDCR
jgi:sporulation protein YlmC with PRC-barrel domain